MTLYNFCGMSYSVAFTLQESRTFYWSILKFTLQDVKMFFLGKRRQDVYLSDLAYATNSFFQELFNFLTFGTIGILSCANAENIKM